MGYLMKSGALSQVAAIRTALANSKLRLFKAGEVELDPLTPKSALEAGECDFSGYPAGGETVVAFNEAFGSGNGAQTVSPTVQFNFVTPVLPALPVLNTVGGFWLENAAGDVILAGEWESGVPMIDDTCSLPIVLSDMLQTAMG